MSLNRSAVFAAKAAVAGLALATLTALASPADAARQDWWIQFEDPNINHRTDAPLTGHWVDPSNPWGLSADSLATGYFEYDETTSACGGSAGGFSWCAPWADPTFALHWEWEGVPELSFDTLDDPRINASGSPVDPLNPGPMVLFFGANPVSPDFLVRFTDSGNTPWLFFVSGYNEVTLVVNPDSYQIPYEDRVMLRGEICLDGKAGCEPPIVTPVPAALPLFSSGLAAIGLAAWRRRRKV
jgi:hypothetical protein